MSEFFVPNKQSVVFLNTPFTYEETPLCPLNIMSVNTLKLISFLKNKGNTVRFINMRSSESYAWMDLPAGRDGKASVSMRVMGKPKWYLREELQKLTSPPDEIWISCIFTFDHLVVREMIEVCRAVYRDVKIVLGGDAVRTAPELAATLPVVVYSGRFEEADLAEPDFSVMEQYSYGIFQLSMGCPNKCAFCVAGLDTPQIMDVDAVISYMLAYYQKHKPSVFWNWDPNVLVYGEQFEEFLDKYAASGIKASLRFGKGFQPNLLSERLIRKMAGVTAISASLPIEAADSITILKHKKPYSIISSIKMLTLAVKYNLDLKNSQCTFIIGYPDDNFAAIFRAYLTVLMLGGKPTPFPVFLFPLSEDYERYKDLLQHKDLSELHGQRWPLIDSCDVPKYQNLLRFLLIRDLSSASRNLFLLTPDLVAAYQRERYLIADFIARCQEAKEDSIEELQRIEIQMEKKLQSFAVDKKKTNILYIVANPKQAESSVTRQLGKYFIDKLSEKYDDCQLEVIDLYKEKITFISEEFIEAVFREKIDLSVETEEIVRSADHYISLMHKADKIVIVCPMWTFSIPSILKAFFEIVTSRLFYYYDKTIEDKPVLCILARHGRYLPPVGADQKWRPKYLNSQEPSLISALQLIGVRSGLQFVCAEGLYQPEHREAVIDSVKQQLDGIALNF